MKGKLITLEGVEGCGKSTQAALLTERLERQGWDVDLTREPGGTPVAEAIRNLLLDPANTAMSAMAELLLYEAARAQHVDERVRPALEAGKVVLCDRYADSTTAYQGAGRRLSLETVLQAHALAVRGTWPDLTVVVDVPVAVGLERAGRAGILDRLESEPLDFHERVRTGYLELARREPERVKVVDGLEPPETVAEAIAALVIPLLDKP